MDIPGTSGTNSYQQWAHVIECPICYSVYDKPMQMGCGHTLCIACVGRLVEQVRNAAADEDRNLQRLQLNEEGNIIGLGGLNDQMEENAWIAVPGIDQRNGAVRAMLEFPPRERGNLTTEIKCPECRKPTVVPPEGLPINYRVQEIVQKVAPLFKDRHLVKHCKQCEAVLNQGVYFDCAQCGEDGHKICSTCAIRLHNGHELVEKKALTSEDVVKMKKLINDASHRAFQAYENVKPRLESVGGVIETKVNEKMSALIKIFEFILVQFESKISDTSTMDQLMIDVKKAEKIADAYEVARERIDVMLNSIEVAFDTFWNPFQQIKAEMEFDEPIAVAVAAPPPAAAPPAPAPAPAPAANPNPNPNQNQNQNFAAEILNHMHHFHNHLRPQQQNNARAAAHFANVERNNRNRRAAIGPHPHVRGIPMWPMGQGQMRPGPMGPGPGQMGPMPVRQGPQRMMQNPNNQGGPPQLHQIQMQQQQQHHQQQQQQQNQPPHPPPFNPVVMEFLHQAQAHLQRHPQNMGPMPNGNMVRMNNGGNMPNLQQLQQHVPLPPQMPNFQQQQQPPQQQQHQQRHPLPHEMVPVPRHPPMPPPNMGPIPHHAYQMRAPQHQPPPPQHQQPHFHNQGGVQPQQLHQHLQHLQHMQQQQQAMMDQNGQNQQQVLEEQERLQHNRMMLQQQQRQQQLQQQQQMQQMAQPEIPEQREDIPRDPDWEEIPVNNAPQFEMQFDNPVEEEPIEGEVNMVQQMVNEAVENYRGGDMVQFQEDNNAIHMVPIEDNNQQEIMMVEGGLGDGGMQDDDDQNARRAIQDDDDIQAQFDAPDVPRFLYPQEIHEDINALQANIQQVHIEQQEPIDGLNQVHPIMDLDRPIAGLEQIPDPVVQLDQFVQVDPDQQQQEGDENVALNANIAEVAVQADEDDIVVIEEQPVAVTRRSQRSVRRSLRNSTAPFEDALAEPSTSEASTSADVNRRSPSPSNTVKRRKMDRKIKQEVPDPEEMDAEEPADPAPRPTKRRAANMASSSSSAGPSTSAPTTRSQTRS